MGDGSGSPVSSQMASVYRECIIIIVFLMFHRHGLCPLLSMPSESIANHASSTSSHHPRTEPEYIPIMMRIIPRCPGKRLLDDDCGCNAKTKNFSRLRERRNMRQRRCTSGIKFALRASKQNNNTLQAATLAAAGHLVHVGSVLLGCKNLVCRCRSMLSPHSSRV